MGGIVVGIKTDIERKSKLAKEVLNICYKLNMSPKKILTKIIKVAIYDKSTE